MTSPEELFRITGRVSPSNIALASTTWTLRHEAVGLDVELTAQVVNGALIAQLRNCGADTPSIHRVAGVVERAVVGRLDLVSLSSGTAVWVEVTHVQPPGGTVTDIVWALPDDDVKRQHFGLDHAAVAAHLDNRHLRHALRDLNAAIRDARDTAHYAHRAVEAVRGHFHDQFGLDADKGRKDAWRRLREALGLDEAWLQELTDAALGPRHGRFPDRLLAPERTRLVLKAREVVGRLCVYLSRGGLTPLPNLGFRAPLP